MIASRLRSQGRPALVHASAWLAERSERERLLLMLMAGLLAMAVAWYGVIQPLRLARDHAVARIELHAGLQARLGLGSGPVATDPAATPLVGPLDQTVRQLAVAQGLSAQVAGDADRVSVTAPSARFEAAVALIRAVERGGARIDTLRMEAAGQPGLVNLGLTASR